MMILWSANMFHTFLLFTVNYGYVPGCSLFYRVTKPAFKSNYFSSKIKCWWCDCSWVSELPIMTALCSNMNSLHIHMWGSYLLIQVIWGKNNPCLALNKNKHVFNMTLTVKVHSSEGNNTQNQLWTYDSVKIWIKVLHHCSLSLLCSALSQGAPVAHRALSGSHSPHIILDRSAGLCWQV